MADRICTRCRKRPTSENFRTCEECLKRARILWKARKYNLGPKRNKGFAEMVRWDKNYQKDISSSGGLASQRNGRGHRWTKEEAIKYAKLSADKRKKKNEL